MSIHIHVTYDNVEYRGILDNDSTNANPIQFQSYIPRRSIVAGHETYLHISSDQDYASQSHAQMEFRTGMKMDWNGFVEDIENLLDQSINYNESSPIINFINDD